MIELKDISVIYPKAGGPAINNVNLTFHPGEFICILGPSGAGKSTLIRTINALQPATSGSVLVNGKNIKTMTEQEKRQWRSQAGMIFQHFHLIPRLTVKQNVLTGLFGKKTFMANIAGAFSKEERGRAMDVIRQVGLEEMADRRVEQLSGGQKQRVGIARALIQNPKVFLGDEPVASLDPGIANSIFGLLKDAHEEKDLVTIINVHDVSLARRFATRIIGLSHGEVIFDGAPDELDPVNLETIYGQVLQA